ncbi:hypothetical protein IFM89_024429 [Coptis chinensis]|uniref:Protein kinase domain-containing protein n=1 Tax=Coptis chinensis TaxID=261450 RepID=A0A835HLT2_9MAGN|nr:hypothetical protein IFM89_024429 [Coptis chinensis]
MALCGVGFKSGLETIDMLYTSVNLLTRKQRLGRRLSCKRSWGIKCCAESVVSSSGLKGSSNVQSVVVDDDEDLGHVIKFYMDDFFVCDSVSIGLGGRGDELVFEAMVRNSQSPLFNKRVVLRRFTSSQAQRRGRRAVEVLKKLARRKLLYHSYSMHVHGYVVPSGGMDQSSFTLVHGYHGSFSLRHWLQRSDWLPTLEATLSLDEERVRKVGDDTVGGPKISRLSRIIRILMRDLLIGVRICNVNYLHSHGLAHTELRLENLHISPLDHHIKVGILGNAADFYDTGPKSSTVDNNMDRRQMMIAFDMRCVGFIMAKMVLRELMDPLIFTKFKAFLNKILDRNWGAGWNLLSLLLATKSHGRITCLDALRHPFLCGPRWRVAPSLDLIRWGLGSTAVRITEEYIYGRQQRNRLAHFIKLMEMLNPYPKPKNWLKLLPGKWRLLYCTGRHIGLTLRQPSTRVLIDEVHLSVVRATDKITNFICTSDINFRVMLGMDWPHDKTGITGRLQVSSLFRLTAGKRLYLKEEMVSEKHQGELLKTQDPVSHKSSGKWRRTSPINDLPSSLPVVKLTSGEIDVTMSLDDSSLQKVSVAQNVIQEVRMQIPPEMFDLSRLVCGTYADSRLLVVRGVSGSALLFTRSCR